MRKQIAPNVQFWGYYEGSLDGDNRSKYDDGRDRSRPPDHLPSKHAPLSGARLIRAQALSVGTRISRLPAWLAGPTMPSRSMRSMIDAARL